MRPAEPNLVHTQHMQIHVTGTPKVESSTPVLDKIEDIEREQRGTRAELRMLWVCLLALILFVAVQRLVL